MKKRDGRIRTTASIRSVHRKGRRFSLLGVLKRLEESAQIAGAKATELDVREAPEREIQRIANEREVERAKLEKARFANKPKFKP